MKEKRIMNKLFKNKYFIICAYGLCLLLLLMGIGSIYGSKVDWLCQHVTFPDVFRQSFYKTGKLIPEIFFELGAGQNAFQYTYYGFLSPGILFSYVLPFVDMTMYIIGLCIISYLASGCLVYKFFKSHFREELAFGIGILFLSLSPIIFHSHHHIMFVWYMPYFLLALIGLDQYFEKKKSTLFIISTFCMILTNYMFSVGCLVYLFVYAVYCILKKYSFTWKTFIKRCIELAFLFVIPVCMSAFVLLPTAYTLLSNSRSGGTESLWFDLIVPNIGELFYKPYSAGVSAITFVAIIGNLTCKNRKIENVFLNAFLLAAFICPVILYALNGTLYVRGKVLIACSVLFLYSFCIFLEEMEKEEIDIEKSIKYAFIFILACTLLRLDQWKIGLCLLFELYLLKRYMNNKKVWYFGPIAAALLSTFLFHVIDEEFVSVTFYEEMHQDEIVEMIGETEGDFYRTNISYREMNTGNRIYGEKFYGTSLYSSTYNSLYAEFYKSYMGNNEKYRNTLMQTGAVNELFYHFMGTKYIIGKADPGFNYELKEKGEHLNLYENMNAFPIVYKGSKYMSEKELSELEFPYTIEALMNYTILQNDKIEKSSYETEASAMKQIEVKKEQQFIYEYLEPDKYKVENTNKTYKINLDDSYKDKIIYLAFDINNDDEYLNKHDISIKINGIQNKLTDYEALYYNGNTTFEYVIPMENKNELSIEISEGKYDIKNIRLYTSNPIAPTHAEVDNLSIDEANSEMTCRVMAKEGEYLVTSIPFDKGFAAFINGQKVETEVVNTAFLGIPLQDGENNVEIMYHAPLFEQGLWISIIGIVLWGIKSILNRRNTYENISSSTML